MKSWKIFTLLAVSAAFTGCATIPKPLAGDFPAIQPQATAQNSVGVPVRWGGTIIATNTDANQTCIEVLGRELDYRARPIFDDSSEGRFIACKNGFQDPQIFGEGREVTITGRIGQLQQRKIGEYEYNYPVVDTEVLYLWPERFATDSYGYAYNYSPNYYGYYGGPFFYSPFYSRYYYGFGYPFGFRSSLFFGSRFGFFHRGFGYGFRGGYSGRGRGFHRGRGFRGNRGGFRGNRGGAVRSSRGNAGRASGAGRRSSSTRTHRQ